MHVLFRGFDSIFHLVIASLVSFFLGHMGSSFLWAILLFYVVYKWDTRVKKKQWRKKFIAWQQVKKSTQVQIMRFTFSIFS